MKAFWIDAGEHRYVEEYIDGWARHEVAWFGGLVYAETAGRAKHLFIKTHNHDTRCNPEFEYIQPMSIRLLATSTDEEWTPGYVGYSDDDLSEFGTEDRWMRGKLAPFGKQMFQEFEQSKREHEELLANWGKS